MFQHDGATTHSDTSTQQYLEESKPDYWPLTYNIDGVFYVKIQATAHPNMKALKQTIW